MEGEVTQVGFGGKVPTYLKMMKCLTLILANKCYIVEVKHGQKMLTGLERGESSVHFHSQNKRQKTVDTRSQLIYTVPASRGVSDTTEDEID